MTNTALLTLNQVADRLNVSDDTVRRAIDRGEMQAFKIAKLWRVSDDQLNEYLQKRLVSKTSRKKVTFK